MTKKNSAFALLLIAILPFLSGFDCKKDKEEEKQAKGISEFDLTSVTDMRARTWYVFMTEEKYFNAAGNEDSTITKSGGQTHKVGFSVGTNFGRTVRPYFIEGNGVLDRFWPRVGEFELLDNGTKITLIRTPNWPEGGPGGTYTLEYNPNESLPFPYSKSLRLEQDENLPGNRKVRKRIILGSN